MTPRGQGQDVRWSFRSVHVALAAVTGLSQLEARGATVWTGARGATWHFACSSS